MEEHETSPVTPKRMIFQDLSGRRVLLIWGILAAAFLTASTLIALYATRLQTVPPLTNNADAAIRELADTTSVVLQQDIETTCRMAGRPTRILGSGVAGFVPYANETALSGLRAHCADISTVYYEAFTFGPENSTLRALSGLGASFPLTDVPRHPLYQNRPFGFPVIAPARGTTSDTLEATLSGGREHNSLGLSLSQFDLSDVDGGVCLDVSLYPEIEPQALMAALFSMRAVLQLKGLQNCLIAPLGATYINHPDIQRAADRIVLLGFQPDATGVTPPSPIDWLQEGLDRTTADLGNVSVAIGSFSRAWTSGQQEPTTLTHAQAVYRAELYQGDTRYAPVIGNTNIRYAGPDRRVTQIWTQDAESAAQQIALLPAGAEIVLWPIGYEDPRIWPLVAQTETQHTTIDSDQLIHVGGGPFLERLELSNMSPDHQSDLPNVAQLVGSGARPSISFVFIGLDESDSTHALLDLLHQNAISATFFLSARNLISRRSEVIQSAIAKDQILGSQVHITPLGVGLTSLPDVARDNLAQLLMAQNFGVRGQFVIGAERDVQDIADLPTLHRYQSVLNGGYIPVFPDISPSFEQQQNLVHLVQQAGGDRTSIVISFDFGEWSSSALIKALPELINHLRARGYNIVPLADLHPNTALDPMPRQLAPRTPLDLIAQGIIRVAWFLAQSLISILAITVIIRIVLLITLSVLRKEKFPLDPDFTPPVTVIIPAYNEATVIEQSVRSTLSTDYPDLRVIVVDDGSTDDTRKIIQKHFGHDPRVKLIVEENHGKWFAENNAINHVETPYFVVVDADTLLGQDALRYLVQPFKDPKTGAVAGLVEVGNKQNFLTACQEIEYKISQSVVRRAYETLHGIMVVPGAIGAWRKSAVEKAGMVSGQTITEDADLTFAIHRAGYEVAYASKAKSYTEVPARITPLFKQRLRWFLGLLQVTWKHKKSVFEGYSIGYLSVIDTIWHRLVVSFILPVFDLIILIGLGSWIYNLATLGSISPDKQATTALAIVLLHTILDIPMILAAFAYERKFRLRLLVLTPFLRIIFRQVLYLAALKSLYMAFAGRLAKWNKLSRTGTAKIQT